MKPRLTKLGAILNKMLDNEDGWSTRNSGTTKLLYHNQTGYMFRMNSVTEFDIYNMPCLSLGDRKALWEKAKQLHDKKIFMDLKDTANAERNTRCTRRRTLYKDLMCQILGVESNG